MLEPSLVLYVYLIPLAMMTFGTWVSVFIYGETSWLYAFIAAAVLIVYPLWLWWWNVLPTEPLSIESLAVMVTCLGLAVIGGATAAITDGTW